MSLAFKTAGSANTNPFTADLDPNASAPVSTRIAELPDRTVNGGVSRDARIHVDFTNPSGTPNIDIVPWIFDETASTWAQLSKLTAVADKDFLTLPDVAPARMFFQLLNFGGGTADQVEVFVAPL